MVQIRIVLKPYLHIGSGARRRRDVMHAAIAGVIELIESARDDGVARCLASVFGSANSRSKHRRRIRDREEVPILEEMLPAVVAVASAV